MLGLRTGERRQVQLVGTGDPLNHDHSQRLVSSPFPSSQGFQLRILSKVSHESNVAHHRMDGANSCGRPVPTVSIASRVDFVRDLYIKEPKLPPAVSPTLNASTSNLVRFFVHQRSVTGHLLSTSYPLPPSHRPHPGTHTT